MCPANGTSMVDQKAKPEAVFQAKEKREYIYTLPNALTLSRILVTPVIGYYVLQGELGVATSLLFVAGASDMVRASSSFRRILLTSSNAHYSSTDGLLVGTIWEQSWAVF